MGFFERNLGALGEAMDDGLEQVRDQTHELCDRQGWTERAGSARERAGRWLAEAQSKSLRARAVLLAWWRGLRPTDQRSVVAGAAAVGLLAAAVAARALLSSHPPPPTDQELELIRALRARDPAPRVFTTEGDPTHTRWMWPGQD